MNDKPRISDLDEETIEVIADRVAAALRAEIEELTTKLLTGDSERLLTVGEVAERFGIARSTVYAHWRDWGGQKLGEGDKTAIRFRPTALPAMNPQDGAQAAATRAKPRRRRRPTRSVIRAEPRLPTEFDNRV